jgi:hypothetical protein
MKCHHKDGKRTAGVATLVDKVDLVDANRLSTRVHPVNSRPLSPLLRFVFHLCVHSRLFFVFSVPLW